MEKYVEIRELLVRLANSFPSICPSEVVSFFTHASSTLLCCLNLPSLLCRLHNTSEAMLLSNCAFNLTLYWHHLNTQTKSCQNTVTSSAFSCSASSSLAPADFMSSFTSSVNLWFPTLASFYPYIHCPSSNILILPSASLSENLVTSFSRSPLLWTVDPQSLKSSTAFIANPCDLTVPRGCL